MSRNLLLHVSAACLIGASAWLIDDTIAPAQVAGQVAYEQIERLDRRTLEELKHFRYDKAEELAHTSLEAARAQTGGESAIVAQRLDNVAFIQRLQHRYDEALRFSRQALAIREGLFGLESVDLCQSLINLALLHELRTEFSDAQRALTRCLVLQENVLGAHHPLVGHTLYMVAKTYRLAGRTLEANELSDRAEQILGPDHPAKLLVDYETGHRERDKTFFGQVTDYHWSGARADDDKTPSRLTLLGEATFNNGLWNPFEATLVLESGTWKFRSILPISLYWKAR